MAIVPTEKMAPAMYTPPDQEGNPDPTRFRLKPLDGMEYLEVMPHIVVKDGFINYDGEGMVKLIRFGLVGWENFRDDGEEIPFSPFNVRRLTPLRLQGIAREIANRSQLTEDEAGN